MNRNPLSNARSQRRLTPIAAGLALLLTVALLACESAAPKAKAHPAPLSLTESQRTLNLESFDFVWTTIRDSHFDPTLGGLDWNAVRDEQRPKVQAARTTDEARDAMSEMLARLKQSHFAIIPASAYDDVVGKPQAASAGSAGTAPPSPGATPGDPTPPKPPSNSAQDDRGETGISLRPIANRLVVTRVREGSVAARGGVRPGWILHSIAETECAPGMARIIEAVPEPRIRELSISFAFQGRLSGPPGSPLLLGFIDPHDRIISKTLTLDEPVGTPTTLGNLPTMYVEFESRRITRAEFNVGYIWFSCFFDPGTLMPRINDAIRSFADCDAIIIDLRGNPGGLGGMALGIAGWFVTATCRLGDMTTREATIKFMVNPRPRPFTRPLAILIDGCSASTAEIFAGGMQALKRARLFGSPTAAAALPSAVALLPNGDGFQYAFANYVSADGVTLEGHGVIPDVHVPTTRESLLSGPDPVIEAALDWVSSRPSPSAARSEK